MKKYMLFTGYNTDDCGIFQNHYDTAPEAFDAVKNHSDDEMYKIIETETNRVLAEGPIKNLIELLPPSPTRVNKKTVHRKAAEDAKVKR
jgi:hypothetical protein